MLLWHFLCDISKQRNNGRILTERELLMNMIKPNCRIQFTPEDIDFLISVLSKESDSSKHIHELLTDPDSIDILFDDERIVQAVLCRADNLKISPRFYFYVLIRHVLRKVNIDDREIADYLAELLSQYTNVNRSQQIMGTNNLKIEYIVDIMAAMEKVDANMQFYLQTFIGNYSLFLSGIFSDHIIHRNNYKAAPKIEYYEKLGESNYKLASSNLLASKHGIDNILFKLSSCFHNIRLALNDLSQRLLFLETPNYL